MFKRIAIILSLLLALGILTLVAGCHRQGKEPGINGGQARVDFPVLRVGMMEHIHSLDPIRLQSFAEIQVARGLYEGLFTLEADTGRLIPHLVEKWELSPDGKTYTFYLRKGIHFHSGREMLAEDVKFSWQRVLAQGGPQELASVLGLIVGAEHYQLGWTETVAGIEVIEPYVLQITLGRPYEQFLLALAHPGAAIVDKQVMQLIGVDYGKPGTTASSLVVLVGTGPFSIVEWMEGEQIVFQPFDQYHGKGAAVKRLEFRQFPDAEALYTAWDAEYLDLILAPALWEAAKLSEQNITRLPGGGFYYLGVNGASEPWHELKARQDLSLSLDREVLAAAFHGQALAGLLPRVLLQERAPRFPYGYAADEVTTFLAGETATLLLPEGEEWRAMGEALQRQLAPNGLDLQLRVLPPWDFGQAIGAGDFTFFLAFHQSSLPTPQYFFETFFASEAPANWSGFADVTVDEKLAFIQNEIDDDWSRRENLLEIEGLVQNQMLHISLWETERLLVWREGATGVPVLPLGLVALEKYQPYP